MGFDTREIVDRMGNVEGVVFYSDTSGTVFGYVMESHEVANLFADQCFPDGDPRRVSETELTAKWLEFLEMLKHCKCGCPFLHEGDQELCDSCRCRVNLSVMEAQTVKDFDEEGRRVAYVPMHAEGNLDHDHVEMGFVTSRNYSYVFVRFDNTRSQPQACDPTSLWKV